MSIASFEQQFDRDARGGLLGTVGHLRTTYSGLSRHELPKPRPTSAFTLSHFFLAGSRVIYYKAICTVEMATPLFFPVSYASPYCCAARRPSSVRISPTIPRVPALVCVGRQIYCFCQIFIETRSLIACASCLRRHLQRHPIHLPCVEGGVGFVPRQSRLAHPDRKHIENMLTYGRCADNQKII